MAHDRKGAIVERIRNEKTRREGVVRLDKKSMWFFARVPDDAPARERPAFFESKDGYEVKRWLKKELGKTTANELLDWLPVVHVSIEEPGYYYGRSDTKTKAGFKINVGRFYIALTKDKSEWLKLKWEQADEESVGALDPAARVQASEKWRSGPGPEKKADKKDRFGGRDRIMTALPFNEGNSNFLPYTPELWLALLQVIETVNEAERHIRALVGTKKGLSTLLEGGTALLTAKGSKLLLASGGEDDDE